MPRVKDKSYIERVCYDCRPKSASHDNLSTDEFEDSGLTIKEELMMISYYRTFIRRSKLFKSTIDILKDKSTSQITNIVCFGIGRITRCPKSNMQLAYILALRSYLKIKKIQFLEPVLTNREINVLNTLDCEAYSKDFDDKMRLDSSQQTLVFLPHCPYKLTNNLLRQNWSAASLRCLIFICNSFGNFVDGKQNNIPHRDACFIRKIEEYTQEWTLNNSLKDEDIFNNIAVHFFHTENCKEDLFGSPTKRSLTELIQGARELRLASPNGVGWIKPKVTSTFRE